jgi:hypothetical protein
MDLTNAMLAKDLGGGKTLSSWSTEVMLVTAGEVILAISFAYEIGLNCNGRKAAVNAYHHFQKISQSLLIH